MIIGCLQFAPRVGDVDNNLSRAESILDTADPEHLDLLVLPELAFSGYNFKTLREIYPFLEPTGTGITSVWARSVALKYDCAVAVGYPETADVSHKWPTSPEYYNSLIMVNKDGDAWALYRKSHLYYTDETWALEGPEGFWKGYLPGIGKIAMGICMDINPYKFEAPWNAFEFAAHAIRVSANVVIVSMAWLTHEDPSSFLTRPEEPDLDTLTYWVQRMEPLIRREDEEEVIVIFANRSGTEDDVLYAGTSAVLGIQDGEVTVYGLLGRGEEKLLVVDTSKPAMAKLQYRPEGDRDIFADSAQDEANSDVISSSQSEGQDSADLQQLGTTQGSNERNVNVVDQSDRCADGYMFDLSDVASTASTDFSVDTGSPMSPRRSWKPTPPDLSAKSSAPGLSETDKYMDWRKWLGECRDRALGATADNTASLDIESAPTMEFSALVEGLMGTKMAQEIAVARPFSTKAGNIN
ncbi:centromere/microtubule-binding protein cbf5 [Pestalotiopsis sp. IQ-011]